MVVGSGLMGDQIQRLLDVQTQIVYSTVSTNNQDLNDENESHRNTPFAVQRCLVFSE